MQVMAVAFPVGVGIALALGVVINYIFTPKGDPVLLFSGVAMIVAAINSMQSLYKKHSVSLQKVSRKGILLSVSAGILMALFTGL